MVLLFVGAWFTDTVGIYAVFGAFVLGSGGASWATPRSVGFSETLSHWHRLSFYPILYLLRIKNENRVTAYAVNISVHHGSCRTRVLR
jgi:hypothetical protein